MVEVFSSSISVFGFSYESHYYNDRKEEEGGRRWEMEGRELLSIVLLFVVVTRNLLY